MPFFIILRMQFKRSAVDGGDRRTEARWIEARLTEARETEAMGD